MNMQMTAGTAFKPAPHAANVMQGFHAAPDYLVIRLGGEQYGLDFQNVVEIRHFATPVPILNAPGYVRGILNFRGRLAPIVDMRLKLGLEPTVRDALTDTVFLDVDDRVVGLLVDGASQVVNLAGQQLRPARDFMSALDSDQILGVAESNERPLTLLDLEKFIHSPEIAII